ncbi:hypothetical protein D9758_017371 [Tetrapyrgos nigripes]|uniref:HAT C-terminal dimerisation domain-containing protein n=1 Tax=Tetrapyrgos nigripes TaxID=182062 RepID=A0A8H5C1F8_9AGAR|nr:hypothetical protein D9758_017371 [Tetrapyrgos nigripes]
MQVDITAKEARPYVESFCADTHAYTSEIPQRAYSWDAFRDAICEFIVSDDQAINTIENPKLRVVFLMLKKDLNDSDIPHRHKIRNWIMELWEEHLDNLMQEFEHALGKISFTSDMWTNSNMMPFLAVIVHWIEMKKTPKDRFELKTVCRAHRFSLGARKTQCLAMELWMLPEIMIQLWSTLNKSLIFEALPGQESNLKFAADYDPEVSFQRDLIANLWTIIRMLKKYWITGEEWDALEAYVQILQILHAFQEWLSGEKTPTLSFAVPSYEAMVTKWEKLKDALPQYATVIDAGIAKLHKYCDHVEASDTYTLAMTEAKQLFLHEVESYSAVVVGDGQQTTLSDLSNDDWADAILGLPTKDKQPTCCVSWAIEDEVNSYLSEALADPKKDEVAYWEVPLDILPIQASSVPCERVFSSLSDTNTKKHNRISPELNEALQMLKFTLWHGNPLSFTDRTSLEEELAVLKQLLAEQCNELEDKKVSIEKLLQMVNRVDK